MGGSRPLVLLVQLPIPPPAPQPVRGNVPLAAGYLSVFARKHGLRRHFRIEILAPQLANTLGDQGMVRALLERGPRVVGFSCYVWNIQRTLWIAAELKRRQPGICVVLGGPEITADNAWVLHDPAVDFAVLGEGEQTFAELLACLARHGRQTVRPNPEARIPGLWVRGAEGPPPPRPPLTNLEETATAYLDGLLDPAEERLMLLETVRGCRYQCKFCYYPKSFAQPRFLSAQRIEENLAYARKKGVQEVFLLDPTLNQRRDFLGFLRRLARANPERQLAYSAELRAEGIRPQHARLMREANFTEVEVGLQSIDRRTQILARRPVNIKALEAGIRAMLDEGIRVTVDLIVGLPGDTADSVRRGIDFLVRRRLYTQVQLLHLALLPGTAFRQQAAALGLAYQDRPPYYVLRTPTLELAEMVKLVEEAQEALGTEFDPYPPMTWELLRYGAGTHAHQVVDLDAKGPRRLVGQPAQALTLWLRSRDFRTRQAIAVELVRCLLENNPHSTLQLVLEPTGPPERLSVALVSQLLEACYRQTNYLDRYYSMHPDRLAGSKRILILLAGATRPHIDPAWLRQTAEFATLVWHGAIGSTTRLHQHECLLGQGAPW